LEVFFTTAQELWKTLPLFKIGEPCQGTYMDPFHKNYGKQLLLLFWIVLFQGKLFFFFPDMALQKYKTNK